MRRAGGAVKLPTEWIFPLGVLTLSLCVGGLIGVLFAASVAGEGGELLVNYLTAYFQLAAEEGVSANFFSILWEQGKLPLCALVLGFSSLGLVGLPILFGVRGFLLTYSVACLWRIFGTNGLIAAGFLFGLTALITLPALFVLGVQGLRGSFGLLRRSVGIHSAPLPYGGDYLICCGGCALAVGIAVVIEWAVVPVLLATVAPLLG